MTKKEKLRTMISDYIISDCDIFFLKLSYSGKDYIISLPDNKEFYTMLLNNFDDDLNGKQSYKGAIIKSALFAYNENSIGRVREALSLNEEYFDTEGDEGVS